jgi:hypothetical protein
MLLWNPVFIGHAVLVEHGFAEPTVRDLIDWQIIEGCPSAESAILKPLMIGVVPARHAVPALKGEG